MSQPAPPVYRWTQPACDECFQLTHPGRDPFALRNPDTERCCLCGAATTSGIYIRIDPSTVAHPTLED
ncbi:hypothetical protein ACTD5D_00350 [Nocardia takedensis]|uniref:hypothetical protein n=1 Tax=Nocardia takedensis TaxID=259390 RepID=UPI003F775CE9